MDQVHEKAMRNGRFAFLLIGIGVLLAVDSFTQISVLYKLWPLLITMLSIGFLGIFNVRGRKEPSYLIPGLYLLFFSLLALYCNFTSWSVLSGLWPVFIGFLGVSFLVAFLLCNQKYHYLLMGLLLISLSAVFFLVFSVSKSLWWTVFIMTGLSILISERAK